MTRSLPFCTSAPTAEGFPGPKSALSVTWKRASGPEHSPFSSCYALFLLLVPPRSSTTSCGTASVWCSRTTRSKAITRLLDWCRKPLSWRTSEWRGRFSNPRVPMRFRANSSAPGSPFVACTMRGLFSGAVYPAAWKSKRECSCLAMTGRAASSRVFPPVLLRHLQLLALVRCRVLKDECLLSECSIRRSRIDGPAAKEALGFN